MSSAWTKYPKMGLDIASTATTVGFSAAKAGTKLGFGVARTITTGIAGTTGAAVDFAIGGHAVGSALGAAVATAFSIAEQVALAPILIGETITSASLVAAQSSIDALSALFPGSDEASFSLASFVTLVKREWNEPVLKDHLPEKRYSVTEIGKALIAWAALQSVTYDWQEQCRFKHLREITENVPEQRGGVRQRTESRIRITEDFKLAQGQIISADIGEAGVDLRSLATQQGLNRPSSAGRSRASVSSLKYNLKRFSKMVLAGYGGAGLIFFGVSLEPTHSSAPHSGLLDNATNEEEHALGNAIDASEQEANSARDNSTGSSNAPTQIKLKPNAKSYSWWNVLMGHHDQEIFEGFAVTPATVRKKEHRASEKAATVFRGNEEGMPRYWVLTDHGRKQVVLVFRGTMSLTELAVDLTCDPAPFQPARTPPPDIADDDADNQQELDDMMEAMPGSFSFDELYEVSPPRPDDVKSMAGSERGYIVHGGMLRMAEAMGSKGKPLHRVLRQSLKRNPGYELILCGHSLGAGVAALLALTWADPRTCLTVRSSGLPEGRHVSVYCYAPPCIACPALSKLCSDLIISFVHSTDIVARLSLGTVRDMTRAAAWLCSANEEGKNGHEEGYTAVTRRAMKWKAGYGSEDDANWFLAIRKTLEANMQFADLFPPGYVLWATRDRDLHPSHQKYSSEPSESISDETPGKVRLFEVLDVEKVFGQIIFSRDMLSSHLPHQYDTILHELQ